MRVGLIADDVTGAGDASVQFAKRGWETFLTLGTVPRAGAGDGDRVIALTTDSRALDNETAFELTRGALARLMEAGVDRVFLKIDSTMRGSVPGQVEGALAAWRIRHAGARAVVCPAYPRMGRTVRAGRLLVNGEPVEHTAIGRDPVTPVRTSDMNVLVPASPAISMADAESDAALAAVAAGIAAGGPPAIAVGSGGLAEALARALSANEDAGRAVPVRTRRAQAENPRILVLVTSLNPVSHAQVARLRAECPGIAVVLAPAERVGDTSVADTLAAEFADRVERGRWDLVGLVGGDGARAALARLGASGIRIFDSLVEGIPLGAIVGGKADGLPVFTKAGGFGAEDALVEAVRAEKPGGGEK